MKRRLLSRRAIMAVLAAIFALVLIDVIVISLVCRDPINRLEISMIFPVNLGGLGVGVMLPEAASAEEVIQSSSLFHHFRILETRKIVPNETVAWIESDRGEKLVFMHYNPIGGWTVQAREP